MKCASHPIRESFFKENLLWSHLPSSTKSYCRESGVRNLRKQIEKIFRKAAFIRVKENKQGIVIDKDNLQS